MDYGLITIKFILGMVCLIFQINILGKGNWPRLPPSTRFKTTSSGELLAELSITVTLRSSNL